MKSRKSDEKKTLIIRTGYKPNVRDNGAHLNK